MTILHEQLRQETRPLHEQTEQLLYTDALRAGTLSVDQYRHLLLMHAQFHGALERAIDRHPAFFRDYEPDTRRKTPWLLNDLAQTGLSADAVSATLFEDWSPAWLLGAAYVGEGSMLGGKTVWNLLRQSPFLNSLLENARFYRGYGADTGQRWRSFGTFLATADAEPADVVEGARQAFLAYQTLFPQTRAQAYLAEADPLA